ncbi:MAG: hypothetical protein KC464_16255, partial [Myxococcales bacterium]|nr:hypothetical protein [Myxococcales bacterium]
MTRVAVLTFVLAAAGAALAACGHSRAPVATEADAARAGVSVAELNQGRRLCVGHCGNCHLPPSPTDFPPEAWPGHVGEMRERAGLDATSEA